MKYMIGILLSIICAGCRAMDPDLKYALYGSRATLLNNMRHADKRRCLAEDGAISDGLLEKEIKLQKILLAKDARKLAEYANQLGEGIALQEVLLAATCQKVKQAFDELQKLEEDYAVSENLISELEAMRAGLISLNLDSNR